MHVYQDTHKLLIFYFLLNFIKNINKCMHIHLYLFSRKRTNNTVNELESNSLIVTMMLKIGMPE